MLVKQEGEKTPRRRIYKLQHFPTAMGWDQWWRCAYVHRHKSLSRQKLIAAWASHSAPHARRATIEATGLPSMPRNLPSTSTSARVAFRHKRCSASSDRQDTPETAEIMDSSPIRATSACMPTSSRSHGLSFCGSLFKDMAYWRSRSTCAGRS
eukprot:scaffold30614_cov32-Tisochrysis_lutea.AAC.2